MEDYWPQNGGKFYWARSDTGTICEGMRIDGQQSCEFRRSIGNIFRFRVNAKNVVRMQQAREEDRLAHEN